MLYSGPVKLTANTTNDLQVKENDYTHLKLTNILAEFNTLEVKTSEGIFTRLLVPSWSKGGSIGTPELPVLRKLIEIPLEAGVKIDITYCTVKEYRLAELGIRYPVFPLQPPVPKTGEPVAFSYNLSAYQLNAFSSNEPVTVDDLGMMRGVRIGRLNIAPFQYNPVTGILRIYEDIEVEISFTNGDIAGTISKKQVYSNQYFMPVFNTLLNFKTVESREELSRYPIKYVIISDRMFEAQLQPFTEWKTKKGFTVISAYTDEPNVGTTTNSIKAYIQDLYDNATIEDPAPTFVLFVGDIDQVPTWTGQAAGHVTDLFYCEYTGDYFPEIYYGRFSANNPAQLQPQIDKTLMYEEYTMPDPSYLNEVVMIAGMDGTFGPIHANGQINYGTENYFNETFGILSHTYLYPESGGNAANIIQDISNGVTFANYTAHGSPDGWADPSFSVSDIPTLQNDGKYGLLIGNACSTSEYQNSECFGEAIVRAVNKGAVGYIGASNSTYWDEDYYFGVGVGPISGDPPSFEETTLGAYNRTFHSHGEPFEDWYTTQDQMIFIGNLSVTLGSPGSAQYYWEAYNLLGDPSLMVYYSEPPVLAVSYDPLIPLGNPVFTVTTEPYAYVALSMDGVLFGAALADSNGVANVQTGGITIPGMADVVVTKQNAQPFTGTVLIANPEGPYVMMNQLGINDAGGNNNGEADYGESILLDMELKNWGSSDAVNARATLDVTDDFIMLSDDYQEFGNIIAHDSVMQNDAYLFDINDSIPDMHKVNFDLLIEDDTRQTWNSSFSLTLKAPVLEIGSLAIVDTLNGNGNNRLDAGENADIVITLFNSGHSDAYDIQALLSTTSTDVTLNSTNVTFDTLAFGVTVTAVYNITVNEDVATGTPVPLFFAATAAPYSAAKEFAVQVGMIIEDFETGDFSSYPWIHSGTQPWVVTTTPVYEGVYSARSGIITDSQTSELSVDVTVLANDSVSFFRKVSCEDDPSGTNYDWLSFSIDNQELQRWDGELDWARVAFPVTTGDHNFKWVYNKDYSVSSGEDAAFIDFIVFPPVSELVTIGVNQEATSLSFQVFPNPARDHAVATFTLPAESRVTLKLYNIIGKEVLTSLDGITMSAGRNTFNLDVTTIEPGIYFCVLKTGNETLTRKFIVSHQ